MEPAGAGPVTALMFVLTIGRSSASAGANRVVSYPGRSTVCFASELVDSAYGQRLSWHARRRGRPPHGLLCGFHIIPGFVVLRASRDILPEVNPLLIVVDVIEMQVLLFRGRHELRGVRVGRSVPGDVRHFLLRLGLNHEVQKLVRQLFVLTA